MKFTKILAAIGLLPILFAIAAIGMALATLNLIVGLAHESLDFIAKRVSAACERLDNQAENLVKS